MSWEEYSVADRVSSPESEHFRINDFDALNACAARKTQRNQVPSSAVSVI